MPNIFISYAHNDGLEAATRLYQELSMAGFSPWRDQEEMRGGPKWKEQLRIALRETVDAVVLLLTPGAMSSATVAWEWESTLTLGKPLIPVMIISCDLPAELAQRHYHDLSKPNQYSAQLAKLLRDLYGLPSNQTSSPTPPTSQSKYTFHNVRNSNIGDNNLNISLNGQLSEHTLESLAGIVAQVSQLPQPTQTALGPALQPVWQLLQTSTVNNLSELEANLQQSLTVIASGIRDLQAGQTAIRTDITNLQSSLLTHFDQQVQPLLQDVINRLSPAELAETELIVANVDKHALSEAQIQSFMTDILTAFNRHTTYQNDQQLQEIAKLLDQTEPTNYLSPKHRLKISIPLIPILNIISYEGEVELGSSVSLDAIWNKLKAQFGRN